MNTIKYLAIMLLMISCGSSEEKSKEEDMSKTKHEEVKNFVDTMTLKRQVFNKQIVCNGKLRAIAKSDITFAEPGTIAEIHVSNGTLVETGSLLAMLDTREANSDMEKARAQMEKAQIDLVDKLIGQGYDADTTKVPAQIMKNVKITSGYNNAVDQINTAKRKLENCCLRSPFSGRVANMDSKAYERPKDKFCTLIDDSYFDVEFSLLEAEIGDIAVGQVVIVSPFIADDRKFTGTVTEINPLIDEKGQIKVRAKLKNNEGYLMEGMNVRIIIENRIANMFVVPKDAVVIRDGYFVLFRLVDGIALWTYVDVVMSNIDSHVITGCEKKKTTISENDIIITSGNLNLANDTAVTPKSK